MLKRVLVAAALASGVVTIGVLHGGTVSAADDAKERRAHLRRVIESFENIQSRRRWIRNGDLSVWWSKYGSLRIERVMLDVKGARSLTYPANRDEKYRFVTERIEVDDEGWWRVTDARLNAGLREHATSTWQSKGIGSWLEDTPIWWKDNFWRNSHFHVDVALAPHRRPRCNVGSCIYGLTVRHQWGNKRGSSNSCERTFRSVNPVDLHLFGLVNKANAEWSVRNTRPEHVTTLPNSRTSASESSPPVRWPSSLRGAPSYCLPI